MWALTAGPVFPSGPGLPGLPVIPCYENKDRWGQTVPTGTLIHKQYNQMMCSIPADFSILTLDPGIPDSPLRPGSPVAPLGPTTPGPPRSPVAPCYKDQGVLHLSRSLFTFGELWDIAPIFCLIANLKRIFCHLWTHLRTCRSISTRETTSTRTTLHKEVCNCYGQGHF